MAQVVIADTGPLLALAQLDCLPLLAKLFGTVLIPDVVLQECMAKSGADSQRVQQAVAAAWLQVEPSPQNPVPFMLPRSLGEGEKEAIYVAMQHEQALLIMDDQLARRQAAKLNLSFIGLVRLLDIAETHGLLASAEQAVENARQAGYRVSLHILRQIRQEKG